MIRYHISKNFAYYFCFFFLHEIFFLVIVLLSTLSQFVCVLVIKLALLLRCAYRAHANTHLHSFTRTDHVVDAHLSDLMTAKIVRTQTWHTFNATFHATHKLGRKKDADFF